MSEKGVEVALVWGEAAQATFCRSTPEELAEVLYGHYVHGPFEHDAMVVMIRVEPAPEVAAKVRKWADREYMDAIDGCYNVEGFHSWVRLYGIDHEREFRSNSLPLFDLCRKILGTRSTTIRLPNGEVVRVSEPKSRHSVVPEIERYGSGFGLNFCELSEHFGLPGDVTELLDPATVPDIVINVNKEEAA